VLQPKKNCDVTSQFSHVIQATSSYQSCSSHVSVLLCTLPKAKWEQPFRLGEKLIVHSSQKLKLCSKLIEFNFETSCWIQHISTYNRENLAEFIVFQLISYYGISIGWNYYRANWTEINTLCCQLNGIQHTWFKESANLTPERPHCFCLGGLSDFG